MPWIDSADWFSAITGLQEAEWLLCRGESIVPAPDGSGLLVRNLKTGEVSAAGHFEMLSLEALQVALSADMAPPSPVDFEIHVREDRQSIDRVDVAHLQAVASPGALFQVASNFNCAEVASVYTDVASGVFVTKLAIDSTQGPAASASAGVSAITRIHGPFYDPDTPPETWGQTAARQLELLGHPAVAPHFPVRNGKLWFEGNEPMRMPSDLFPKIRVGLHCGAVARFGKRRGLKMARPASPPTIDQVFVAALNMYAPQPHAHHLEPKARLLLRAAYEGTYLSAIRQGTETLVLTLVGGGSFANPMPWIIDAIAQAHRRWGGHPASRLQRVILPLFPINGMVNGVRVGALLQEGLQQHGVDPRRIRTRRFSAD